MNEQLRPYGIEVASDIHHPNRDEFTALWTAIVFHYADSSNDGDEPLGRRPLAVGKTTVEARRFYDQSNNFVVAFDELSGIYTASAAFISASTEALALPNEYKPWKLAHFTHDNGKLEDGEVVQIPDNEGTIGLVYTGITIHVTADELGLDLTSVPKANWRLRWEQEGPITELPIQNQAFLELMTQQALPNSLKLFTPTIRVYNRQVLLHMGYGLSELFPTVDSPDQLTEIGTQIQEHLIRIEETLQNASGRVFAISVAADVQGK